MMGPSDRGFDDGLDGELLTERCYICDRVMPVRADDPRSDGPWLCEDCREQPVHELSPLTRHLFETAALMARLR